MKRCLFLLFTGITLFFSLPIEAHLHFLHIPKTAGMTLNSLLEKNFPLEGIYANRQFGNNGKFSSLPIHKASRIFRHKFVSAHFPFWFFLKYDPNFGQNFIVTVLRDPVERVISFWRYATNRPHAKPGYQLTSPLEVDPNTMCKMLASDPTLQGEDLLKSSIENLQRIDFIIFQDDFENGLKTLFTKLNFPIPQEIQVVNPSPRLEISHEVIEKIKELNDLDIKLYEFANQHLREKFRK